MSEDKDMETKRKEVAEFLGEAFLGFLGAIAHEAEMEPSVAEAPEALIPEGKTPEQFMEKIFGMAKKNLVDKGRVNPGIFAFRKGHVKTYFIRNCPGGEFIAELVKQVVKNEIPEAYGIITETWLSPQPKGVDPKDVIPPSMDPNAKEALVGLFKGKEQFQLVQVFRHDEQEHNKIVLEGDTEKMGGAIRTAAETQGMNTPLRDPTRDYIG